MESWLITGFLLGAVQGLTEFLPVSSTGHLIIAGELLGFTGPKASTFEVVIQLGSILAVVVLYWPRFMGLLFPNRITSESSTPGTAPFAGWRGIGMLFLTTLPPSILGLLLHPYIKKLFTPANVAAALAVGAILMLLVEQWSGKRKPTALTLDDMTPKLALGIGCCQCIALWPGFSRSASTIMGGMLLGARRSLAAEYSFIAAVPLMVAATGYDLFKTWTFLSIEDLPLFGVGMLFSFLFALAAIKTFIALVGRLTLRPFAWYRLALAPVVYYFLT